MTMMQIPDSTARLIPNFFCYLDGSVDRQTKEADHVFYSNALSSGHARAYGGALLPHYAVPFNVEL